MRNPITREMPHVVIRQGHKESDYRRNDGCNPRPPFPTTYAVPRQCSDSNAGCGYKSSSSDMQMHDVVHDCRIECIQIGGSDSIQRRHSKFKTAARKVAEEKHHCITDER